MIAGHAVSPICPRCSRPVRGSIQLHAIYADLSDLLVRADALAIRAVLGDLPLHARVVALAERLSLQLRAELAGVHFSCRDPDPQLLLEDLAAEVTQQLTRAAVVHH